MSDIVDSNPCLDCYCYDSDFCCTMSSLDKIYFCPYFCPEFISEDFDFEDFDSLL